jgi:hypothetical protein
MPSKKGKNGKCPAIPCGDPKQAKDGLTTQCFPAGGGVCIKPSQDATVVCRKKIESDSCKDITSSSCKKIKDVFSSAKFKDEKQRERLDKIIAKICKPTKGSNETLQVDEASAPVAGSDTAKTCEKLKLNLEQIKKYSSNGSGSSSSDLSPGSGNHRATK